MLIDPMRIKARSGVTRKQKAYLKWMGFTPPKSQGRLAQLNKHNRSKLHQASEFILMVNRLEEKVVNE